MTNPPIQTAGLSRSSRAIPVDKKFQGIVGMGRGTLTDSEIGSRKHLSGVLPDGCARGEVCPLVAEFGSEVGW
jgi:hypothetical protein